MDEKKRKLSLYGQQTWENHVNANYLVDPSPGDITVGVSSPITSLETTQSRGHAWPRPSTPNTDVGGNFTTTKVKSLLNYSPGTFYGSRVNGRRYIGPAWAISPHEAATFALSLVNPSSESALAALGTSAISKVLPTNPLLDGSTAIGELKAGLPKFVGKELLKDKFKDYRTYGSEYLNVEFGWKPMVSDLKALAKGVIESEKILDQLHRDSGKNIRRKYSFQDEIVTTERRTGNRVCWVPSNLTMATNQYDGTGTLYTTQKVTTRTWFSGCFTYHLNLGSTLPDKIARQAAEARKLYGLELTPAAVWNLTPWSWAVDWEGNIGDVLHNVSRFSQDGLVMRYGYIMQSKTAEIDYTLRRGGIKTGLDNGDLRFTVTAESKVRRRATPFGFGFDMNALNGRQSAILGALGISRGPRHL